MRNLKLLFALSLFSSFVMLTSCEKADKLNVVNTKTGLDVSGAQEVPPVNTPARGVMAASYNRNLKVLTINVDFSGLTGIPIGAHIHGIAPKGVNAPIVVDLTAPFPKSTSGNFQRSVHIPSSGINEESLLNGLYYFNVHTPMYPGGEIRGQIILK